MPRFHHCLIPALGLLIAAAPADKKPPADPNKVHCKSELETGSLVRRTKTCHTEAEWQRLAETGRHNTQEMQTSVRGATAR